MKTFFATKLATTSIFTDSGRRRTVTNVLAGPLKVTQVKTKERDGYFAVQVSFGKTKREIRLADQPEVKTGDQILAAAVFTVGDKVKVTGVSKGRGFAGVMKRHGFHGGPKTHGQSDRQRAPGSIGMRTTPGRVWKGKKMAGHYGVDTVTTKNLTVINLDEAKNILTVSGTVPGGRHGLLTLTKL
ncbi:MAG: 50S ribosomal protein L3 [Patescibacteria group bacterium]|nr:50S ribosomal protein L3 [Candidatus Beckwithbacteria bacterium]MDZ4228675.1 50S ribosomal protein L3 [Patescibacteria group bacterium]